MIGDQTFPENHPLVRGGSFAVWNDHVGNGITAKDVHHRVFPAMQVLAKKMWNGADTAMPYETFLDNSKRLGEGPGLNMMGRINSKDSLVLAYDFTRQLHQKNGKDKQGIVSSVNAGVNHTIQALQLNGGNSFIQTPLTGIGYGYTVGFSIYPGDDNPDNAVLFSSADAVVKLKQLSTGRLGFSREGYDYAFNYTVPVKQWSHIVITGDNKGTSLYVNGVLKERLTGAKRHFANGKETAQVQTLFFPLQYIGHPKHAFKGYLNNIKVFNCILTENKINLLAQSASFPAQ
jgi:hexosaminidase